MAMRILDQYLKQAHVPFSTREHPQAFTAMEIAERTHVTGNMFAKTVIVKADGKLAMLVMPAPKSVDFEHIATALGCRKVELAMEYEFKNRFVDCEVGAEPPFGNLFDIPVFVDADLAQNETIIFNAGSLHEVMEMQYGDFAQLVKPKLLDMGFLPTADMRQHVHPRMGRLHH